MMKPKAFLRLTCMLIPILPCLGHTLVKDRPIRGEWIFSPEKIWEVEKAGDTDFGRIAELLISDNNNIILRDFQRNVSLIFDDEGRFLKSFAARGDGEGQLPFYLNRFQAGDKIVLAAPDKLHYFTPDGTFVRAVSNNLFLRFPLRFINENEFIYAPCFAQSPVHEKKLVVVDLSTGRERVLADFAGPDDRGRKPAPLPMVMIDSLIPQVRLADDGATLFVGRSDEYAISSVDHSGHIRSSFSLDRKRSIASPESKRDHFAGSQMPREAVEKLLAQLPDEMTHFSRIQAIRELIYVFAVTTVDRESTEQALDIFSPKGEFLYRGNLRFDDGAKFNGTSNLVIKDEFVYVILNCGQGKLTLAKYRIKLPQ